MVQPASSAPGPSVAAPPPTSSLLVSYQDIFEHLELARHHRDADQIRDILTHRKADLTSCLQPFPIHTSPDQATTNDSLPPASLKLADGSTHSLDQETRNLCKDIAARYNTSHQHAFALLRTFLAAENRSLDGIQDIVRSHLQQPPPSPVKSRASRSRPDRSRHQARTESDDSATKTADLLDAFNIFYFEERMYLLRTISSLIRITEDPQHVYYHIAIAILDFFADEAFALQCIDHFVSLVSLPLPESIRQQPRYSTLWAKQILREQFGLLEIVFLLFYGRLSPSPKPVLALLGAVHQTEVGRRQANLGFFDAEAAETVDCLGHLLVLIAVELLSLEEVMDGLDLDQDTLESHISKNAPSLEQALDLLSSTSADPLQAPILLAWRSSSIVSKTRSSLPQTPPTPRTSSPPAISPLPYPSSPTSSGPTTEVLRSGEDSRKLPSHPNCAFSTP